MTEGGYYWISHVHGEEIGYWTGSVWHVQDGEISGSAIRVLSERIVLRRAEEPSDLDKVCEVLDRYDLERLRETEPFGDYRVEADALLQRIVDEPMTAQYVRDVWLVCYAVDDKRGRHKAQHRRQIRVYDMPMRREFKKIADELNVIFHANKTFKLQAGAIE